MESPRHRVPEEGCLRKWAGVGDRCCPIFLGPCAGGEHQVPGVGEIMPGRAQKEAYHGLTCRFLTLEARGRRRPGSRQCGGRTGPGRGLDPAWRAARDICWSRRSQSSRDGPGLPTTQSQCHRHLPVPCSQMLPNVCCVPGPVPGDGPLPCRMDSQLDCEAWLGAGKPYNPWLPGEQWRPGRVGVSSPGTPLVFE